jgi:hypothetical protein
MHDGATSASPCDRRGPARWQQPPVLSALRPGRHVGLVGDQLAIDTPRGLQGGFDLLRRIVCGPKRPRGVADQPPDSGGVGMHSLHPTTHLTVLAFTTLLGACAGFHDSEGHSRAHRSWLKCATRGEGRLGPRGRCERPRPGRPRPMRIRRYSAIENVPPPGNWVSLGAHSGLSHSAPWSSRRA